MCIIENMSVLTKVFKFINVGVIAYLFVEKRSNFGLDQCPSRMSLCCDYRETLLLLKFVIIARCNNLIFNMNLLCMFCIYH